MESTGPNRNTRTRDGFSYDLSNAIYGQFPSCATTTTSPLRSRATSPQTSTNTFARASNKRKATTTPTELKDFCRQKISLNRAPNATTPTWLSPHFNPNSSNKLRRQQQQQGRADNMATIHQSVLLNLSAGAESNTESEMWMLPELDDWEADSDTEDSSSSSPSPSSSSSSLHYSSSPATRTPQSPQAQAQAQAQRGLAPEKEWSGFLHRAAKSNLERLRARLEAEGWDFAAGAVFAHQKGGGKAQQQGFFQTGEDCLDEEFDVIVLAAEEAGC